MLLKEKYSRWALIDIAVNLTDEMFHGKYNGKTYHKPDFHDVAKRAIAVGVQAILITAGSLQDAKQAIQLCEYFNTSTEFKSHLHCLCTVGCHPTRCNEFLENSDVYFSELSNLICSNSVHSGGCVAAVGEIGLDFDRLSFCSKEVQEEFFKKQLLLAEQYHLPVYLHNRNTYGKMEEILRLYTNSIASGGVVHSFTDSLEEAQCLTSLGLYIGINGCSLKTEAGLNLVKNIPINCIMIETDAPYCGIRNTHASYKLLNENIEDYNELENNVKETLARFPVKAHRKYEPGTIIKNRNEPCYIIQILEVIYKLRRNEVRSLQNLAAILSENTMKIFPFKLSTTTTTSSN